MKNSTLDIDIFEVLKHIHQICPASKTAIIFNDDVIVMSFRSIVDGKEYHDNLEIAAARYHGKADLFLANHLILYILTDVDEIEKKLIIDPGYFHLIPNPTSEQIKSLKILRAYNAYSNVW